jgi:hypothetical protein
MTVNGAVLGSSDGAGFFSIRAQPFSSADCQVTVSDGTSSAQATLAGCTPSQASSVLERSHPQPHQRGRRRFFHRNGDSRRRSAGGHQRRAFQQQPERRRCARQRHGRDRFQLSILHGQDGGGRPGQHECDHQRLVGWGDPVGGADGHGLAPGDHHRRADLCQWRLRPWTWQRRHVLRTGHLPEWWLGTDTLHLEPGRRPPSGWIDAERSPPVRGALRDYLGHPHHSRDDHVHDPGPGQCRSNGAAGFQPRHQTAPSGRDHDSEQLLRGGNGRVSYTVQLFSDGGSGRTNGRSFWVNCRPASPWIHRD